MHLESLTDPIRQETHCLSKKKGLKNLIQLRNGYKHNFLCYLNHFVLIKFNLDNLVNLVIFGVIWSHQIDQIRFQFTYNEKH